MLQTRSTLLTLLLGSLACGGAKPPAEPAKAEETKSSIDEEALARRKAEREAKEKAAKEAEEAKKAALEQVAVLPDKLPKDVVKACEDVAKAHDAFMQRMLQGPDAEKWNGIKETQLPMTTVQCTQTDSVEVAACQKHAFDNAGPELKDAAGDLMRACIDKFGKAGPGGAPRGPVPPKPPGR